MAGTRSTTSAFFNNSFTHLIALAGGLVAVPAQGPATLEDHSPLLRDRKSLHWSV